MPRVEKNKNEKKFPANFRKFRQIFKFKAQNRENKNFENSPASQFLGYEKCDKGFGFALQAKI